jgi:hypothetical protein
VRVGLNGKSYFHHQIDCGADEYWALESLKHIFLAFIFKGEKISRYGITPGEFSG